MSEDRDKMFFELALLAKTIRFILVLGIAITLLIFVGMILSAT